MSVYDDSDETKLGDLVEKHLSYRFKNIHLFLQAVTHKSWINENQKNEENNNCKIGSIVTKDYQRLEFLGDATLKLIQSTVIHNSNPTWVEGQMTELRASYENNKNLSLWAQKLGLHKFLRHGQGLSTTPSGLIYAQIFEAVVGAIWIDCNFNFINICSIYSKWGLQPSTTDEKITENSKKELQELLQINKHKTPEYTVIEKTGPNHQPTFTVSCTCTVIVNGETKKFIKTSKATSIKQAEKEAASHILIELRQILNKPK